jgi:iron complex transport system substrate-binding protein
LSSARAQDATPGATSSVVNGVQPDGSWAFTDDRGVTVTLPAAPERVVADINVAATLWDFGIRPVGIFGWNVLSETEVAGGAGGNVDLTTAEIVSEFGTDNIDVEKLIGVNPDLIVSLYFGPDYGVWSINPDVQADVDTIAPTVCLSGFSRADVAVGRSAELAGALGIDLESAEIAEQQIAYESAIADFSALMESKGGLSALFVAPSEDSFYVANPRAAGDVAFFQMLGLVVPELPVGDTEYWQQLSYEEANTYPTDVLLYSLRGTMLDLAAFTDHPTFSLLSAVKAGQVYPWNQDVITNYVGVAKELNTLIAAFSDASAEVGSI